MIDLTAAQSQAREARDLLKLAVVDPGSAGVFYATVEAQARFADAIDRLLALVGEQRGALETLRAYVQQDVYHENDPDWHPPERADPLRANAMLEVIDGALQTTPGEQR